MSLKELPEINVKADNVGLDFEILDTAQSAYKCNAQYLNDDDESVITIYGAIGYDYFTDTDNTEDRIYKELKAIGDKSVTVNINSQGGNFFNGIAIYNLLKGHKAKITINIIGIAASAASVIAMAGDEINMGEGSFFMVHNAWACVCGNKYDIEESIKTLSAIDDAMIGLYASRTGASTDDATKWVNAQRGEGTWFSAIEAIDANLADGMIENNVISDDTPQSNLTSQVQARKTIDLALAAQKMSRTKRREVIKNANLGKSSAANDARTNTPSAVDNDDLALAVKNALANGLFQTT